MSYGFTGRIFRFTAKSFFKTVTVKFVGEYETHTIRTTATGFYKRVKLPSRWLAKLYAARINKNQYSRYNGTEYSLTSK